MANIANRNQRLFNIWVQQFNPEHFLWMEISIRDSQIIYDCLRNLYTGQNIPIVPIIPDYIPNYININFAPYCLTISYNDKNHIISYKKIQHFFIITINTLEYERQHELQQQQQQQRRLLQQQPLPQQLGLELQVQHDLELHRQHSIELQRQYGLEQLQELIPQFATNECAICLLDFDNSITDINLLRTPFGMCGHSFHNECIRQYVAKSQHTQHPTCPLCRGEQLYVNF